MQLPCWIAHRWGKFGDPYVKEIDIYLIHDAYYGGKKYQRSERRTYQDRVCEKCGIINTVHTKTSTFIDVEKS